MKKNLIFKEKRKNLQVNKLQVNFHYDDFENRKNKKINRKTIYDFFLNLITFYSHEHFLRFLYLVIYTSEE